MADYASYAVVGKLPELQAAANETEVRLRAEGDDIGADKILRAYAKLRDGLILLSEQMAVKGSEILRRHEHDSRVRPDTLGGGGPRLEDYLEVDPLLVIPGSIGIANESLLDDNVPWWVTNEVGNSANVGRILFGAFFGQGGESRPSASESRVHPLFEPRGAGEFGGSGVIQHAIPARYFVRDSVAEIQAEWRVRFEQLVAAYVAEVTF